MLTIKKEKRKLVSRLRKLSDGNITYLAAELNMSYQRLWRWFKVNTISDRGILQLCNNSKYSYLISDELKEYIYAKYRI